MAHSFVAPINARLLPPEEIARHFVAPPRIFETVLSQNHVVLLGPRGSGKTTLLSMLTQPAQRVYANNGDRRGPLPYIGVLVRADLTWSRQLRAMGRSVDPATKAQFIQRIYVDHCSTSLIRFIKDYVRNLSTEDSSHAGGSSHIETTIARRTATMLGFSDEFDTFGVLKDALLKRSQQAWRVARTGSGSMDDAWDGSSDIFAIAAVVAESLEELGLIPSIALLLDELELVPESIRDYLVEGLRDADSRVLVKLSLSPVEGATERLYLGLPAAGQDFLSVDLTYPQKTQGYSFTDALIADLARRHGSNVSSARQLLGPSRFDLTESQSAKTKSYSRTGALHRAFVELAEMDATFAEYLIRHGVTLDSADSLAEWERAATVRKVRDIVLIRSRYLKDDGATLGRRGAKSLLFYAGHQSVLALLEGNPRWVVNFMSSLNLEGRRSSQVVRSAQQGIALADVLGSIRSRISTSPVPLDLEDEVDPLRGRRILELVDAIGTYQRDRVLGPEFDADPPLTFVVDGDVSTDVVSLISDAVSHGAIIHIPRKRASSPMQSPRGQRFRLAYLMAAEYQLPPILGREMHLSSILSTRGANDSALPATRKSKIDASQMRLFPG